MKAELMPDSPGGPQPQLKIEEAQIEMVLGSNGYTAVWLVQLDELKVVWAVSFWALDHCSPKAFVSGYYWHSLWGWAGLFAIWSLICFVGC